MRIADFIPGTRTHGPGVRSVVQVQGCRQHCPGCIAEHTWNYNRGRELSPAMLAEAILKLPVEGVTFTGGEPFDQAEELAQLAALVRTSKPNLTMITFTGYRIGALWKSRQDGIADLLSQMDVVIDGPYIQRLDDGKGLRGSSNQQVIHLTDRLKGFDFERCERLVEWHQQSGGQVLIVGIPTQTQKAVEEHFFSRSNHWF